MTILNNLLTSSLLIYLLTATTFLFAADYYVDKNNPVASDSNPGTKESPWSSILKASSTLQPGDTVYIREGTYYEVEGGNGIPTPGLFIHNSGKLDAPITYKSYPGERAIIDQRFQGVGFQIFEQSNIIIEGLEIKNALGAGVRTYDHAQNITIKSTYIHDIDSDVGSNAGAVRLDGTSGGIVENNIFHTIRVGGVLEDNAAGIHGYSMENIIISNNLIYDAYDGVFHKKSSGKNGLRIENNIFRDVTNGVWYSVQGVGSPPHVHQIVKNNLFLRNSVGIRVTTWETSSQSQDLYISNNTFINSKEASISIIGMTNVKIWNNIFYGNSLALFTANNSSNNITDIAELDYNLHYPSLRITLDGYGDNISVFNNRDSILNASSTPTLSFSSPSRNSIVGDPKFKDINSNYTINIDSPAHLSGKHGDDIGANFKIIGPGIRKPTKPMSLIIN